MAMLMFSKARGQVAVFQDPSIPGLISLRMDNWLGFQRFKSIITRVAISTQGNYQVLHSLGGDAFLYVFGDRVGQVIVSGLAFDSICGDSLGSLGIERIARYYNANRLAARQTPIRLTIGAALTLKMYLAGVTVDVEDVATKIWRFSFVMLQVPEPLRRLSGGRSFSSTEGGAESGEAEDDDGGVIVSSPPDGDGTPDSYPTYSLAGSGVDAGGYDPDLSPQGVPAGSGRDAYGTGPQLSVRGFQL